MKRFMLLLTVVAAMVVFVGCDDYTPPTSVDGSNTVLKPDLTAYELRNEDAMYPNGVFAPWGFNCTENLSATVINDSTRAITGKIWCLTNRSEPRIKVTRHYNGGEKTVATFNAVRGKDYIILDTITVVRDVNTVYYTAVCNARVGQNYVNSSELKSIVLTLARPFKLTENPPE